METARIMGQAALQSVKGTGEQGMIVSTKDKKHGESERNVMGKAAVIFAVFLAVTAALAGCRETSGKAGSDMEKDGSQMDLVNGSEEMPEADGAWEADRGTEADGAAEADRRTEANEMAEEGREMEANETVGADGPAVQGKKEPPQGWELTLESEDWGLSFGEPGACPAGNASAEDLAWYDAFYAGSGDEKVIYLTFDCGYENGNTEPILDALKKHNAKAAFFVVGHFLETAPDMARRMAEEGHAVGNHTYHHLDMPSISDPEVFQKEMDDVADLFQEITGKELAHYYRPPQGKCNAENLKTAQELGYRTVFWSLAYVDWNQDDQPSHEEAFDKLTTRVHPGAVVLLHNTSRTNGEILDGLLTKWEDMGYSFKPLEELCDL